MVDSGHHTFVKTQRPLKCKVRPVMYPNSKISFRSSLHFKCEADFDKGIYMYYKYMKQRLQKEWCVGGYEADPGDF
jgi:hypothetical protein